MPGWLTNVADRWTARTADRRRSRSAPPFGGFDERAILQAEAEVGGHLAAEFRRRLTLDRPHLDPQYQVQAMLIAELGEALAQPATRQYRRTFDFTVVPDPQPAALALPGGHIFISAGLLRLIGSHRDYTAFILGHEMGHVIQQHPVKRIVADRENGGSVDRLRSASAAAEWLDHGGFHLLWAPYSPPREFLADRHGARLLRAAGLDPTAGIRLLRWLQSSEAPGHPREGGDIRGQAPVSDFRGPPAYFASHPPIEQRIEEIQRYLANHVPRRR